uniref:Uncharacterized protein n=1 Tax=Manihot esculenta TaxID=3983 RepID=A0A2C9UJ64_MANES
MSTRIIHSPKFNNILSASTTINKKFDTGNRAKLK